MYNEFLWKLSPGEYMEYLTAHGWTEADAADYVALVFAGAVC